MIFLLLSLLISFPLYSEEITVSDDEYFFEDYEGITVTGTIQTSQRITLIEKAQITASSASDVVDLLQETLGLNVVRYGAYGNRAGIVLRGFDSKRIAFLINGIQVNSSMDGSFDITQVDINSIERIEVIYGGSDTRYNVSGAFGGVVNIITVRRQERGLRITASVSNISAMPGEYRDRNGETQGLQPEDLLDTQNYAFSINYGGDPFSLTINAFANNAGNHFLFTDHYNYTRRKDNNEVWDAGGNVTMAWELHRHTNLIVSSSIFYSNRNFPSSGFSANFGNQRDISARQNLLIDMPRVFYNELSAELSVMWQFHRLEYTSPAEENSMHDQNNFSAVNRWNWHLSDLLTLRSGIDYRYINIDSTEIGRRNRHDGGIFMTAEYQPLELFMVIPSFKIIFTNGGSENFSFVPKLGLVWNVTENFTLKNNYYRSYKFPDFEELYWNGGGGTGNPDLRPEDGWGSDLSASWRITETLQFESAFFAQFITDSIHWFSGSGGVWHPENVGEAALFGFDSKIIIIVPFSTGFINRIITSLSYNNLITYLLSYGYSFNSNNRIPYSPEHTINISITFEWNSGTFSISGRYESRRYHDTANMTILEPVFLLNTTFNQNISSNFTIYGALRNILNTSYESFYDCPMPGITLTLGIRMNMRL